MILYSDIPVRETLSLSLRDLLFKVREYSYFCTNKTLYSDIPMKGALSLSLRDLLFKVRQYSFFCTSKAVQTYNTDLVTCFISCSIGAQEKMKVLVLFKQYKRKQYKRTNTDSWTCSISCSIGIRRPARRSKKLKTTPGCSTEAIRLD